MTSKNPPLNLYKKIVASFIILTVVLVLAVLYLSFSEARIDIIPAKKAVSAEVIIDVAANPASDNVLKGSMVETILSDSRSFSASGEKSSASQAEGRVTVYNNYSKNQPLIRTTRLLSPEGLLFRLKETVNVPAGGQVEVDVYADKEGAEYELGPTKFTIPGLWVGLQDKIFAKSYQSMRGGTSQVKVVTTSDIESAKDKLAAELAKAGREILMAALPSGQVIPDELFFQEVMESSVEAAAGEKKEEFKAEMTLRIIGLLTDEQTLLSLAETKLRSLLPRDQKLISINKEDALYTLEKYDLEAKRANLKVYIEGTSALNEASLILNKDKLIGLKKEEAQAYLTSFDSIKDVIVNFYPFWLRKVPRLKDHIKIKIDYEQ